MSVVIIGTGSYIPEQCIDEKEFLQHEFYNPDGSIIKEDNARIIQKFKSITGIEQRRYALGDQSSSDLGTIAAQRAITDAGIDPETLGGIIVAHNYGDVPLGSVQSDTVPSMASRIKHNLRIKNADCMAFDVLYGCPGWIQGMIIADRFLRGGNGGRFLVIGTETLSRVSDPHDRDSMIYADGAGAVVVEQQPENHRQGIISWASRSYTYEEAHYLFFGASDKPGAYVGTRFIKMYGRKIYEFALNYVPMAMKDCLDKAGLQIDDVKKVLIHQANEKMDEAIIGRLFKLYGRDEVPQHFMPMSIHTLGNSSVATVPTLLDLVLKGKLADQKLEHGDIILMASVGAGMNINAIAYRL
ncbi:MAG: ketoacyl-ACP synthase III [Edaphocola sp.]